MSHPWGIWDLHSRSGLVGYGLDSRGLCPNGDLGFPSRYHFQIPPHWISGGGALSSDQREDGDKNLLPSSAEIYIFCTYTFIPLYVFMER
jgi:hypothetical protein